MARWTNWRIIADRETKYTWELDWSGPSIYELSITGPRGGNRLTKYLGETQNEKVRISNYARNGSHLWELIDEELERGNLLWYRSLRMKSKDDAAIKEKLLLSKFDYPWNKRNNS
ncbi:MAG: hypothetical protein MUC29_07270 [Pyrinomonadaceae bacterium]|jgi:hypothetical protein|nr:hypothetical protein [Pyrinomonadaceae bacterium]